MSQVINTNVASLNAQRNLNASQGDLQTSLERLSSGLRINSAGDDAAGLAISERFSAQISGLEQAQRNSNDGISFAQTAEGGLDEIGNLLQRVRELSVQAANDTNSNSDRQALNEEVQQAIEEVNRIAASTQFNDQNVLDGSLEDLIFQVGANAGQTIGVDGVDSRGSNLGAVIDQTESLSDQAVAAEVDSQPFDFSDVDFAALDTGEFSLAIGGTDVNIDETDLGDVDDLADLAAEINSQLADDGIEDIVFEASDDGETLTALNQSGDDQAIELALADGSQSNNVVGAAVLTDDTPTNVVDVDSLTTGEGGDEVQGVITVNGQDIEFENADAESLATLAADIQAELQAEGFDIDVDVSGTELEFTNNTGSEVNLTADLRDQGADADNTVLSASTLDASEDLTLADQFSRGETVTFDVEVNDTVITVENASSLSDVTSAINAESVNTGVSANLNATNDSIVFSADRGEDFTVDLTVAGEDGRDGIEENIDATAEQDSVFVNDLSVTSRDEATQTITAVDFAIDQVNSLRGDLGATQNRFESTIANLSIGSENLQAARSRIVDADFASETADLTRAQILQQAGTSVLAQANQIPQNVVSLLQ